MIHPPIVSSTGPWIAYALLVGLLLAVVAMLGESVLRAAGRPARWIWAATLGLTVALVALAPTRSERAGIASLVVGPVSAGAAPVANATGWRERAVDAVESVALAAELQVRAGLALAARAIPPSLDRALGAIWASLSIALLAVFGLVYARFARARLRWPLTVLHGTRVRVAPDAGPAVVGLSRPEIVVPGWLLERTTDEQRLVLAHEREHVRARDPLLLAAACVAAVIIPWHPAVWWMLSRLRLAVELDCDARVLRHGVAPRSYGTLLIDLAGRCSGLRIGAPALADESSHLHQRLIAMTPRTSRFTAARATVAAALAGIALLAACEAKLPTQTEVNGMTAATATASAQKLHLLSSDSADAQYRVNGVVVSAAEASAIPANRIASIEVLKGSAAPNGKALVSITTRQPGDTASGVKITQRVEVTDGGVAMSDDSIGGPRKHLDNFTGVILIDGVRSTESAMQALAPTDIVSVEVIKGPSAAAQYDAPEAKNGVIRITTKKGAAKQ